ncbi:PTS sugar transporter subunit IIA [Romboutsia sp. 1001713B170131_170501_G6]|uniref:PTS sugar transporter subunit IIA n=1 Tax=Romboutsia sp. 1001713B170131_170501_G6 TaxID=2787108 RepID=UPI0018AC1C5B|nr:PTS glucose transporter subunit IIA [Romboutsia sp. 1001713B170131_170501_G6]
MGIFDIFKKKNKSNIILAPTNGEILELSCVPDEVFSNKIMGDGFAIKSNDGVIVSPVDATVEMIFDTKHAMGLKTDDGLELLIHLGIDTVNLKGKGFEIFTNVGDRVKAGDKIMKMDVDFIKNNATSDISPIIFTSLEDGQSVKVVTGAVEAKEENRIEIVK